MEKSIRFRCAKTSRIFYIKLQMFFLLSLPIGASGEIGTNEETGTNKEMGTNNEKGTDEETKKLLPQVAGKSKCSIFLVGLK